MTTAIISLVSLVLGIIFWFLKRRDAQTNDPQLQNRKRYEQIDRDIATQNSDAATLHSNSDLDELDRVQRATSSGDQRRPN
ncbi:MAG: hypothetical protein JWO95_1081 [Verrucomicrobiales bacterium]|nr:hypothetical protein [Verrucomicrobiales bacterium]